jgi:hypothetical protein
LRVFFDEIFLVILQRIVAAPDESFSTDPKSLSFFGSNMINGDRRRGMAVITDFTVNIESRFSFFKKITGKAMRTAAFGFSLLLNSFIIVLLR